MQLFVCIIVLLFFSVIEPFSKQKIDTVLCHAVKRNFFHCRHCQSLKFKKKLNNFFSARRAYLGFCLMTSSVNKIYHLDNIQFIL